MANGTVASERYRQHDGVARCVRAPLHRTPETTSTLLRLRSPSASAMPWPPLKSSVSWPLRSATLLLAAVVAGLALGFGGGGLWRGPEVKDDVGLGLSDDGGGSG